jgi:ABC-type polysaccharide/polyol phosphate export permease
MDINYYDSSDGPKGIGYTLKLFWKSKTLIYSLAMNEVYGKYKRSILGLFWSFLNPAVTAGVIYFVFGKIFRGYLPDDRGYAGFVYSGILLQVLIIQGVTISAQAIPYQANAILKMRLNPGVFSVASGAAHTIHFCIGIIGLAPLMFFYQQPLSWRFLGLPIFLLLAMMMLSGLSMLLCGLFIRFDDTLYLLNALMMVVSYLTPLLYPIGILSGLMEKVVLSNPVTSWVLTFRWLIFENQVIYLYSPFIVIVTSILIFLLGIKVLNRNWTKYVMYL